MGTGVEVALWSSVAVSAVSMYQQQQASGRQAEAESRRVSLMQSAEEQKYKLAQKQASIAKAEAYEKTRIKRASLQAGREQAGVGATGGTGIGGEYALASRAASNMGFFGQQVQIGQNIFELGQQASTAAQDAIRAKQEAGEWGAVGGVSSSIFTAAGGYEKLFGWGKKG